MNMRRFMCEVGACGLRGCTISESDAASKPRPASSGRRSVAAGGMRAPFECVKFTAVFSITGPFSRTRGRANPPPDSSRCSTKRALPSCASSAPQMRSWRSSRNSRTGVTEGGCMARSLVPPTSWRYAVERARRQVPDDLARRGACQVGEHLEGLGSENALAHRLAERHPLVEACDVLVAGSQQEL